MRNYGERIKLLRETRGWSQKDLALKAGVTKSAISTYEQAVRTPSADVVCSLAKAFGVTADYLLGLTDRRTIIIDGLSEHDEALICGLIESLLKK